jgi:DNA (cytosine-5)-methyltransferase 1
MANKEISTTDKIRLRPRHIAINLFAGAGGLSLGFKKGGFQFVQAVENDYHTAATYRCNHPEVDLLEEDIRNLNPLTCLQRLGLQPGDVAVLIGGPPCKGFSESNRRTRTLANPKNHLYKEFLRFLEVIQPTWFVLENVAGLRTLSNGAILQCIVKGGRALGYEVKWEKLNSVDYGVPQFRRRIFIIGNRLSLPIRFPEPTHGHSCLRCTHQYGFESHYHLDEHKANENGYKPYVTVREAISDLPKLENGASIDYLPYDDCRLTEYQRTMRLSTNGTNHVQGNLVSRNSEKIIQRYEHIGPGQNWKAIPPELLDNYRDFSRCHTGIYYRLEWDKPSKVIGNFRKNMLIHPEQHRGLSVREAARLQSFPDNHIFLGSIGFQQQQVADAVPPILGEIIARCIRRKC